MSGNIKYDKWINDDNSENYKCRAWVNFNGVGTVAIRASGNVSSLTDLGVGSYKINFTIAMVDANYAASVTGTAGASSGGGASVDTQEGGGEGANIGATTFFVVRGLTGGTGAMQDLEWINAAVFR